MGKTPKALALVGKTPNTGLMVAETPNPQNQLLPDRHPQHDLFICDVADAVLKDVLPQMEHPFYSLSKKPETSIRRYEHNGNWLEVTPSVKGLATIYDKDILIYCISQIMAKIKLGEPPKQRVRINSRELLMFANRGTAGKDYTALCEAVDRLAGTRISTNIKTGDEEQYDSFGLIDAASIRRKHGLDGRLLWVEVKLSDWVFNAIRAQEVLTLHRDYFRLRRPIERRVYELARKHCGQQEQWQIGVPTLHKKSGSKSELKEFRRAVRHLAEHNHLPDYSVQFRADTDLVIFRNRGTMYAPGVEPWAGYIDEDCYEDVRNVAPGWNIYHLEDEYRAWLAKNELEPRNPAAHFVKWARTWYKNHGKP